jgi:hypothetical protein
VEVAERHADGLVGDPVMAAARSAAFDAWHRPPPVPDCRAASAGAVPWSVLGGDPLIQAASAARQVVHLAEVPPAEEQVLGQLLCCLFGDPFRPLPPADPAWFRWRGGAVRELAWAAYTGPPGPEGTLDRARLAVLAAALEEAGCTEPALLRHLCGPGPHVRGCWAVDLLLFA